MHTGKSGASMQLDMRSNRPHSHFLQKFQRKLLLLHPGSFPIQQSPPTPITCAERDSLPASLLVLPDPSAAVGAVIITCIYTTVGLTEVGWFMFQKGQGLDPSRFSSISSRPLRKSSVSHCSSPGQCSC